MKREKWTPSIINMNEIRVRSMQVWCSIIFQVMVSLARYKQDDPSVELGMGKYHSAVHFFLLVWFLGDIRSMDTSSLESYHRWACTNLFWKTSGKYTSNLKEMAERCQESIIQIHDNIARLIRNSDNIEEFRNSLSDADKASNPLVSRNFILLQNSKSKVWRFGDQMISNYMHNKAVTNFENRMNNLIPLNTRHLSNFKLVTGITIIGDHSTLYQDGILYCSPKNAGNIKEPIYSAISFMYEGRLRYGLLVAAISLIQRNNVNDDVTENIIFHIALMEVAVDKPIPVYWPFTRLQFEYDASVNIVCIYATDLIDHLFLYPDFIAPLSSLSTTNLDPTERYWLIPRDLFDRKKLI